jgi:hypothetical protein
MTDFVAAQHQLLSVPQPAASAATTGGGSNSSSNNAKPELGFEMVCALLNNSVDCYNQSLEFTEHVQVRAACVPTKGFGSDDVKQWSGTAVAQGHIASWRVISWLVMLLHPHNSSPISSSCPVETV